MKMPSRNTTGTILIIFGFALLQHSNCRMQKELETAYRSAKNATAYDCRSVNECASYAKTMREAKGHIFTRCLCGCELSDQWREGCEACYFIEVPKGE